MPSPRYLVGIDLGTTHTVVAYAELKAQAPILRFALPQLIAPGEIASLPLLPSVRYHPAAGELSPSSLKLPWQPYLDDPVPQAVIGELARKLGAKSCGRQVVSAKSWLCHGGVDRTAPILPWGSPAEVPKVSPLLACASYLAHVRGAWNFTFPDHPLEHQEVVVTLPASFAEDARALTLEAAKLAGLQPYLLEEPQAVCYDWLYRHRADLTPIASARLLLVVDIGGGTTDLTLLRIDPGKTPKLTRIGVGEHLLLGGDNLDLALAFKVEKRLCPEGKRLTAAEFSQLVASCRLAKERLLGEKAPESASVSLLGSGAQLIGGSRTTSLTRAEVLAVLEEFFPEVTLEDLPQGKRSGLIEFGLPYAADPAIPRHIAAFLTAHASACRDALGEENAPPVPDTVLLNGGVFLSPAITERLLTVMAGWSRKPLKVLDNPHPEGAVASGAVAYAMARRGLIPKIGGGAARSYFLVVEGETGRPQGVCLLPRGTEEGQEIVLQERVFALRLGKPVRFHLVSSTEDKAFAAGQVIPLAGAGFTPLPPLVTAVEGGTKPGLAKVRLAARLTEIGTLELECVALEEEFRVSLNFELRRPSLTLAVQDASHPHLDPARTLILAVFGKRSKEVSPKLVKTLRQELEKHLGERHLWDLPLLRELADCLLEGGKFRRRSQEHERTWFNLTGFALRPGFGYPLDEWRIDQVFPLYPQGLQFVKAIQNWAEWWTFWRRIAGGLDQARQEEIFKDLKPLLDPSQGVRWEILKQQSYENLIRLAASLEYLTPEDKIAMGEWFLERLNRPKEPQEVLAWALGRLGSRIPFYASSHTVVPKAYAERWLEHLLALEFKDRPHLAFAASLLARRTGDRERDIDEELRKLVLSKLKQAKAPLSFSQMVKEVIELSAEDQKRLLGESLPPGLKLIA
jgi:molecular chaperone DnaK (HSP70)